jgi:predicted ATPase
LRAGERATERSANLEAVAHLKRGIEILMRLPESSERDEQELLLQFALTAPLTAKEGYASEARAQAAKRAVELGGRISTDSPAQFQAVWAGILFVSVHLSRGELRIARSIGEKNLALAKRLGDPFLRGQAHFLMGQAHFYSGDLGAARKHFETGLALYDPGRDRAKAGRYGRDLCTFCHSFLGHVLSCQGFPDKALRQAKQAIAAGRAAAHPLSEAIALSVAASIHQLRDEETLCLEQTETALVLCTEQILPFAAMYAMAPSGWALAKQAQAEIGLGPLRTALDAYRATGARLRLPDWLALLAEACLASGRIEDGLSVVREALDDTVETGVRWYEAELYRLEGELLLVSKEPDESRAEASFRKAIEIARGQGARSFELRAALGLARLWRDRGKRSEAYELLGPAYGWFSEGFETPVLREAKALLKELL